MNNVYRNVINWFESRNIKVDEYGGLDSPIEERHAFIEVTSDKYSLEILDHEEGVTINLFYYHWEDWDKVEKSEFYRTYKTLNGAIRRIDNLIYYYDLFEASDTYL